MLSFKLAAIEGEFYANVSHTQVQTTQTYEIQPLICLVLYFLSPCKVYSNSYRHIYYIFAHINLLKISLNYAPFLEKVQCVLHNDM